MSRRRLVLLDIDGTILHGGRFWKECFEEAFLEECARSEAQGLARAPERLPKISFSGKTDRQICRELLQAAGHWPEGTEPGSHAALELRIDSVLRGYLDRARAGAPGRLHEIRVMPGVRELVAALATHADVTLGLLTGNVREGARLKLECVGLHEPFVTGVFGDDHWDRYELPAIAVARARAELGLEFAGKQVVIVGDTIHDIGCGQEIGARAIAVGTGHAESRARVLAAWRGETPGDPRPDHYFDDLSELAAVLSAILREG